METDFSFLFEYDRLLVFVHIAGAVLSVGAVTIADLVLAWVKFNPKKAPLVARITNIFSLQVWIGLLISSISGILLYLPRAEALQDYSIFQLKMLVVLAVFINGIILNLWIDPKFKKLAPEWHQNTPAVKKFTKLAGISAAISFIGWWGIIFIMKVLY